ncbi:MAG: LysE family transporter [Thermoplasmatota archaeon]
MPLWDAAFGLGLGLSLAAPPGPVNALIAREAASRGAWAGIRAGVAAPILDSVFLVVTLVGVSRVVAPSPLWLALGGLVMAYLAFQTARERATGVPRGAVVLVTLTNPFQYVWWLSAGVASFAGRGWGSVVGFEMAIFGWVLVLSFLVAYGARRWEWLEPLLAVVCADLLALFSLDLLARALSGVRVAAL